MLPHAWSAEYREIVTFYFWEPQHLRPRPPTEERAPTSWTPDEMWEHVAGLEVATNHILNLYLSLVPFDALNSSAGWCLRDEYEHVGSLELREAQRRFGNFTQPDLYLRGKVRDLAIEIKTKSRSSLEQVHKYVCFQELMSPGRPMTLLFLTPYPDSSMILQGGYPLSDIPEGIRGMPAPRRYRDIEPKLANAVDRLEIGAITFHELSLRATALADAETHPTVRRVHQGLLSWLSQTGLSSGQTAAPSRARVVAQKVAPVCTVCFMELPRSGVCSH